MSNFLDKLFCKHAYVYKDIVLAGEELIEVGSVIADDFGYEKRIKFYEIYRCIKCGKIKTKVLYKPFE